jgi:hypothetical protein
MEPRHPRVVLLDAATVCVMEDSKTADHPSQETVDVRQGTGPRATVSVLFISLALAAIAAGGLVVYAYFLR